MAVEARTVVKVVLAAAATVGALYLLWRVRHIAGLVMIAVFVAIAIAPLVELLDRRFIPRVAAILLSYLAVFATIFGLGMLVVPPIVSEVEQFVTDVPGYVQDIRQSETLREYDEKYGVVDRLEEQAEKLPTAAEEAGAALRDVTVGVFTAIFELVIVLVIAIFLLLEGRRVLEFGFRQLPAEREQRARAIAHDVYKAVGGYVVGVVSLALLGGATTYAVLSILGIPFAVPLAVLMGFFVLIPLVGATIAGIVIAVVAALHDFPTAPIAWVAFLILYQQLESHLLAPFIYNRTVKLHPLLVIVGVLLGAALLGIVGALLAIPIAATIQILVKDWWHFRGGGTLADRPGAHPLDGPGGEGPPGPSSGGEPEPEPA